MIPIVALAALHIVCGVAGLAAAALDPSADLPSVHSPWIHLAQILVFTTAAGWLVVGTRGDIRAVHLGVVFMLAATGYAIRPIEAFEAALPPVAGEAVSLLFAASPDAFFPLLLWLFLRDFPRAVSSPRQRRIARLAVASCVAVGAALFVVNLFVTSVGADAGSLLERFGRGRRDSLYWLVLFGLTLPAPPFVVWKTRTATAGERRRVSVFVTALVAGATPAFLYSFAFVLIPELEGSQAEQILLPFIQLAVLSIPIATAYSVLVNQVLEVRLIVRAAIRYAFARTTVFAAIALPFVLLTVFLVQSRDATVGQLLAGPRAALLLGIVLFGLLLLRFRSPALDAIDQRFFREEYDARQILGGLAQQVAGVATPDELSQLVATEVDRALHLDAVAVLTDGTGGPFQPRAGGGRPLDPGSPLARALEGRREPLGLDLESPSPEIGQLPLEERQWIADGGFRLLVPLRAAAGTLLGMLALGSKRSELPYSGEDRELLSAIAASAALSLESQLVRTGSALQPAAEDAAAGECVACRLVQPADATSCNDCNGRIEPSPVPEVLHGKFLFERRVGAGGMGVVYRAIDLTLARPVAAKTLPAVSPERAVRLRREARATAAVVHPNLALIYGAETWRGTPILISEFLDGGTLASRLSEGPIPWREGVSLGLVLGDVLERIHSAGILHRDVKPSNIGFTSEGVPKLLDFGVARIVTDSAADPPLTRRAIEGLARAVETAGPNSTFMSDEFAGTPLYLSPEALAGDQPDASFDLWGAAVILYESIAGRHPFQRDSWRETAGAITRGDAPDLREHAPDCPEALTEVLRSALSSDRAARPASGRELHRRLESIG